MSLAAGSSVTTKSIVPSSSSVASASATDRLLGSASGPGIVNAAGTCVSTVPPAVQMPPEAHAASATSANVTSPSPSGVTAMASMNHFCRGTPDRSSSIGLSVNVLVTLVSPAGSLVPKNLYTAAASSSRSQCCGTFTYNWVCFGRGAPFSVNVAVISVGPAFSHNPLWLRLSSSAVEAISSSVIVSVAVPPFGVPYWLSTTVSSPSPKSSSIGVNVNVAVPLVESAGIVTVKSSTAS